AQVGVLSSHSTKYSSPTLKQKMFTNMRRVGKGFSRVDTPLFEGMLVVQQVDKSAVEINVDDVPAARVADEGAGGVNVDDVPAIDKIAQALEIKKLKQRVKKLERRNKLKVYKLRRLKKVGTAQRVDTFDDTVIDDVSKQGRIIASMDADVDVTLKDVAEIAKKVALDAEIEESADIQGRQAESQAQIYQIDLEHVDKVLSMQDDELEPVELQEVVEVVTTTKLMTEVVTAASATITTVAAPILTTAIAPTLTTAPSASRRRKGVVIRDPEETAIPSTIIHFEAKSKDKEKGILVEKPKPLKKQARIEQDEAYARELKVELNKNINWDDVIDQVQRKEKEDNVVMRYQALKRKPQTEAQARKNMMIYLRNIAGLKMDYFKGMTYDDIRPIFKKKFNFNATPLARKVLVVDYEIYTKNNKPYYKIIRADGSPQLFLSFLSLLRNFDKEDLEVLWQLVKERFTTSKPKNFLDDFLLTTLTYMFKKPDVQAQVWKNQRTVHGLAKVKS
nr:hypothetical protein [Tanacetum cinerariifolium]